MGFFANDFYDTVKNEVVVGMLQGAFTYEQGKGGEMKRACDLILTQHFLVTRYDPVINVAPGIFGFSSTDNFKNNIGNSKVVTSNTQTIMDLAPDPKSISQAVPLEKVELVSMVYFSVGGGLLDSYKIDVGMIHLRIGGKFLGMRENMIFTQSQFDNVVNLFKQTSLASKMEIKKEIVGYFFENLE
jgi:hypothetical protein